MNEAMLSWRDAAEKKKKKLLPAARPSLSTQPPPPTVCHSSELAILNRLKNEAVLHTRTHRKTHIHTHTTDTKQIHSMHRTCQRLTLARLTPPGTL